LGQLRRSSGTIGFFMIASAASTAGTAGTDVRPAPSRAPRSLVEEVPTRRVILVPPAAARADPRAVEASRFDARDTVEGVSATPAVPPAADVTVDEAPVAPGEPHTSQ
jgi:hypothetical protein